VGLVLGFLLRLSAIVVLSCTAVPQPSENEFSLFPL
jgi:hypothetical protein